MREMFLAIIKSLKELMKAMYGMVLLWYEEKLNK